MIYPDNLKKGDKIGVLAVSNGLDEPRYTRMLSAKKMFENLGFIIEKASNVTICKNARAGTAKQRAKQFMDYWLDENIKAIMPVTCGNYLVEILTILDFKKMKRVKPKWVCGSSDISLLLYVITTNLNVATIHCDVFREFGMLPLHKSLKNTLKILQGEEFKQFKFERFA
jgi:muramoyltetrapeptide carboxypeptidase LdcA involved in peptidoglycan recycling